MSHPCAFIYGYFNLGDVIVVWINKGSLQAADFIAGSAARTKVHLPTPDFPDRLRSGGSSRLQKTKDESDADRPSTNGQATASDLQDLVQELNAVNEDLDQMMQAGPSPQSRSMHEE
ncbi:uncharacterized protein LOC144820270 [Lissotriton helveticus]